MSFITQCPACQTLFKVQADALSASGGKGRCSTCNKVFNAFEHRFDPDAVASTIEADADEAVISDTTGQSAETPSFSEQYTAEEVIAEPPQEPEIHIQHAVATAVEVPETLFQRQRFDWPKLVKPLTTIALLLIILLAQTALFFRSSLVASHPQSYPTLATVCKLLRCSVDLPRRAGLIIIEDHSLRSDPDHVDLLILEGSFKNGARYPQAYPLLQLTLTNKPNSSVASRGFTPQEYLPAGTNAALGIAPGKIINFHLNLGVTGIQSNAYQLIAKDVPILKPATP